MSFLEWSSKYELGIGVVDEQHERLFQIVNSLYDSVVNGEEQNVLGEILDELIDYTVYHFETEEEKFEHYSYPKLQEHKREHNDLTLQVLELQKKFYNHELTITYDVLDFLSEWLKDHTTNSDYEFASYYKKIVP